MADQASSPPAPPPPRPRFTRGEAFVSHYANNVQFEAGDLDLKMIFGQSEQTADGEITSQHTAITLTWAEAKLVSYFLQVHVTAHEAVNGKINIPKTQVPPEPPPPPPEAEKDKVYVTLRERIMELRGRFLASL